MSDFSIGTPDLQNHTIQMNDGSGRLVTMDLGTDDVHIAAALTNFVTGYSNAEMKADLVAPPQAVAKQSDYYFQFDADNAMAAVDGTEIAPGADPPFVGLKLGNTLYYAKQYALGCLIPQEVIANQDAPLKIEMTAARMVMDRLLLNREIRVKNAAFNTANFTGSFLLDLSGVAATRKWNGGTAATPVADLKQMIQASLMPVTDIVMARPTWDAFAANPEVQKYTGFKDSMPGLPTPDMRARFAAFLDLPMIHVAEVKAKNVAAGTYPYVWANDVVLLRRPPTSTVSDMDITTFKTFRWPGTNGPTLPGGEFGGSVNGGFTVRAFYNPFKGTKGMWTIIVAHHDAEMFIPKLATQVVGGYIKGAYA